MSGDTGFDDPQQGEEHKRYDYLTGDAGFFSKDPYWSQQREARAKTKIGNYVVALRATRDPQEPEIDAIEPPNFPRAVKCMLYHVNSFVCSLSKQEDSSLDLAALIPQGWEFVQAVPLSPEVHAPELHHALREINEFQPMQARRPEDRGLTGRIVIGPIDQHANDTVLGKKTVEILLFNVLNARLCHQKGIEWVRGHQQEAQQAVLSRRTELLTGIGTLDTEKLQETANKTFSAL